MVVKLQSLATRRLGPTEHDIRIFASFDLTHDLDLHDLLLEHAQRKNSGFEIAARSEASRTTDSSEEGLRARMRLVDEVIVVCGEQTRASANVEAELRIAHEEEKPYFLLWGRREGMCTRPVGARHSDNMYSWTSQILQDQMIATLEAAQPREVRKPRKQK